MADEILKQGVQGISDIIVDDALINLDFADVTTIMKDRGIVHMGVGRGTGRTRLEDAVQGAITVRFWKLRFPVQELFSSISPVASILRCLT